MSEATLDPGVIVRTFAADLAVGGDGRTIDVRIVPYGEQIQHNDGLGGLPRGEIYREEWVPGAFADQVAARGRESKVWVNVEHEQGIRGLVGHGLALREAADGFYGSFELHDGPDGEKAKMLVGKGILDGVSLEAKSKRSVRDRLGVVRRVKAHLVGIALCRDPAYKGARVLALREDADEIEILEDYSEFAPREIDPELVARCRALGVSLPTRYDEAHPDDKDTSSGEDTSDVGTGHESDEVHSTVEV